MNRIRLAGLFMFFIVAVMLSASGGFSETGFENATRVSVGEYNNTTNVTAAASATTLIFAASNIRPDATCRNNSAYVLWIGSNTVDNDLYRIGFPVLSSETFKVGSFQGSTYGQGDGGAVDVRCWLGLVQAFQ